MHKGYSYAYRFCLLYFRRLLNKRNLLLALLLFLLINIYLAPIKDFSEVADCKVSPWIYPFLITDANFLLLFMAGIIYYFSTVPFMKRWNSYYLLREGRNKWLLGQIKYIVLSAYTITILSILLSWIALLPRLKYENGWGKVIFTLGKSNVGEDYGLFWKISVQYISKHTAVEAMLCSILIIGLGISFLGMLMLFFSLLFPNPFSVAITTIVVAYSSIVANVDDTLKMPLALSSPVSWMRIAQMDVTSYGSILAPSMLYVIISFILLIIILGCLMVWRIRRLDFIWDNEGE